MSIFGGFEESLKKTVAGVLHTKERHEGISYDAVLYESFPYSRTTPLHLHTLATFFGMQPADIHTAKVLELGCASGGNLIPLAMCYPNAEFEGVDLSEAQCKVANDHIDALKLKNIKIEQKSILDLVKKDGKKYDYIICHGIFSWVPPEVQEGIFKVCQNHLTDQGVAVVSYNTLPGWNAVKTIRDMMLYHTAQFENPKDKIAQARHVLEFIIDANRGTESPHQKALLIEADLLANQPDSYLAHDHLEHHNDAVYFHDFINRARAHELSYLADGMLSSMFVHNLPEHIAQKLLQTGDIVRTEQYMDFINNRRFRSTLLARNSAPISRNLQVAAILNFYLSTALSPETPVDVSMLTQEPTASPITFKNRSGGSFVTRNPHHIALLSTLSEQMIPVNADELVALTIEKNSLFTKESLIEALKDIGLRLVMTRNIEIVSDPGPKRVITVSKRPRAYAYAQYQARSQMWVTNLLHDKLNMDIFSRVLIQYADGSQTVPQLEKQMFTHVRNGDLRISTKSETPPSMESLENYISLTTRNTLTAFAKNGLLEA